MSLNLQGSWPPRWDMRWKLSNNINPACMEVFEFEFSYVASCLQHADFDINPWHKEKSLTKSKFLSHPKTMTANSETGSAIPTKINWWNLKIDSNLVMLVFMVWQQHYCLYSIRVNHSSICMPTWTALNFKFPHGFTMVNHGCQWCQNIPPRNYSLGVSNDKAFEIMALIVCWGTYK